MTKSAERIRYEVAARDAEAAKQFKKTKRNRYAAAAKKIAERDGIARQLTAAQGQISLLWARMCNEEGVPVEAKFVVFNSANKHSVEYNEAVQNFFALRAAMMKTVQQ
jgi:hypothetical protein